MKNNPTIISQIKGTKLLQIQQDKLVQSQLRLNCCPVSSKNNGISLYIYGKILLESYCGKQTDRHLHNGLHAKTLHNHLHTYIYCTE